MTRDERLAQLADEIDDYLAAYGPANAVVMAVELCEDVLDVVECLERLLEQDRVYREPGPTPDWVEMSRTYREGVTTNH